MKYFKFISAILLISYVTCSSINVCVDQSQFTDSNFQQLVTNIDALFPTNDTRDFLARTVRLTFHDCVSGCNGCVDFSNTDNLGLEQIVGQAARLFRIYGSKTFWGKYKLSRADIYALMGYRAIYIGSNFPGLTIPTCEFKIGRKDCTGPQDNKEIFASSLGNWEQIFNFFQTEFKFTTQEIVAIMGAHTLGRTWSQNSGYRGAWVAHDNRVFSNAFYQNMLNKNLNYQSSVIDTKQQWSSNTGKVPIRDLKIMLNSDMCLLKKFNIDANGVPNCTYNTCETNTEPAQWVETYANSEPKFKADFSKVFQKMLEHGYEGTNTLIDIIPNLHTPSNVPADYSTEINEKIWKYYENSTIEEQFKIFHFLNKKKYEIESQEGMKRKNLFSENLKIIKDKNSKSVDSYKVFGLNAYTDMTFEEYFKLKYRVDPVHLEEYSDLDFNKYSHLLKDA